jgi:opacity protein-like surface antigen
VKTAVLAAMIACSSAAGAAELFLGIQTFHPQASPQLRLQDPHPGWAIGFGWRPWKHVALDLELVETGQEADMPDVSREGAFVAGKRELAHVYSDGIAATVRFVYPIGSFAPYAGAGFGLYRSEVSKLGPSAHLILPPDFSKRSDDGTGTHAVLGIEYAASPQSIWCIEYRRLVLEADFGPGFGPAKLGGASVRVAYRRNLQR